jgi:hypothetical protein
MTAKPTIHFTCPCCEAEHTRGYIDGVALFRCLRCGYQGYGFHPDPDIDRGVYLEHVEAEKWNAAHGVAPHNPFDKPGLRSGEGNCG